MSESAAIPGKEAEIVLEVTDLSRHYVLPRASLFRPPEIVYALNGVSFRVARGQSFGVVGESGCGKSTLARLIMALEPPSAGKIRLLDRDIAALAPDELRGLRRHFQMVFQDPFGSLDPRLKVGRIVGEPVEALEPSLGRVARGARVVEVLRAVGMRESDMEKYPHEFSGGQRQRIAIARALITRPDLIVADEPVSALDVSVQAQVLNLLKDLQERFGVTYMLISHDLGVVDYVCDEVAVMYLGRIVEQAPTQQLFADPHHPYTRALLEAAPKIGSGRRRQRSRLKGAVSGQIGQVAGCPFAERCPAVRDICTREAPPTVEIAPGHHAVCHFA